MSQFTPGQRREKNFYISVCPIGNCWHVRLCLQQKIFQYIGISSSTNTKCGPGSSVSTATDYGLDGPGIESRGARFSACPDRPWGPPNLLYIGYRVFPGVKYGRGVLLTTHLLLVPRSWKSRAIPLLTLWATTRPVTGTLYVSFTNTK